MASQRFSAMCCMAGASHSEPPVRCTVSSKKHECRRTARPYNGWVHHAPIRDVFLISVVIIGKGIVILEPDPSPIPAVPAVLNRCLAGLLAEARGRAWVQARLTAGGHTDSRHDG